MSTDTIHPADRMYLEIVTNAQAALAAGRTSVGGIDVHRALAHVRDNARSDDLSQRAADLITR